MLKDGAAMHTEPVDAHTREYLNITGFPRGQGNQSSCWRNCMTQRDKDNGKAQAANVCAHVLLLYMLFSEIRDCASRDFTA